MPLTPSPTPEATLEWTMGTARIDSWEEEPCRTLMIRWDPPRGEADGYDAIPLEMVCVEELDELITELQRHRNWLAQ